MSHSYGLGNLIMPLVLQGTALRLVEDPLPDPLRQALGGADSLVFPGVPALFDMLSVLPESDARFAGLRLCISAGAPLRAATAAAFRRRFHLPVRTFYGASESGGIAYDASEAGLAAEQEEGCVGTPLPGVEIRLEGEEARIAVKSAAVASGYLEEGTGRPDEGVFRAGKFLTGDTGRLDPRGRLTLTGRIGALVNVAGRKVNPLEVEALLRRLPGVGDVAVLGVPDEARGESLVACLVAQPEVTRETIMRRLRQDLTAYKLPRRIVFLEAIPRTERGKIDRAALLRRAGDPGASDLRR
ncbi:MAG TPA: fatty acid--CoA ligase family protein, partial [Candidatus Polarisedimenticolia bacterium]|nr:fatty acid--CoA ligase family protein [Candidatus Polarisedimenticolia bacterium]